MNYCYLLLLLLQANPERMLTERHYAFPPLRIPQAEGVTQNELIPLVRMPRYDPYDMMQTDEENRYSCLRVLEDPEDSSRYAKCYGFC